jgi:hypothetical protein
VADGHRGIEVDKLLHCFVAIASAEGMPTKIHLVRPSIGKIDTISLAQ